jgi:hypothetical protein
VSKPPGLGGALLGLVAFGIFAIFVSIPNGNIIYAVAGLGMFGVLTICDFNRRARALSGLSCQADAAATPRLAMAPATTNEIQSCAGARCAPASLPQLCMSAKAAKKRGYPCIMRASRRRQAPGRARARVVSA